MFISHLGVVLVGHRVHVDALLGVLGQDRLEDSLEVRRANVRGQEVKKGNYIEKDTDITISIDLSIHIYTQTHIYYLSISICLARTNSKTTCKGSGVYGTRV